MYKKPKCNGNVLLYLQLRLGALASDGALNEAVGV